MRAEARPPRASLFREWSAKRLRPRPAALALEAPLVCGRRWLGGDALPRHGERRPQLLDETLDCELAVAQLASLVLRDRSENGPRAGDHTSFLRLRELVRGLDVEDRLDARGRLLCVLPTRPARARGTQLDLGQREEDGT